MSRIHTQPTSDGEPDGVAVNLPDDAALKVLEGADIVGGHRISSGSNYTFMVYLDAGPGKHLRAIYKPRDGERPLHDFPQGSLYKREYAAYLLGKALGWPNIPMTLIRDGPYGVGSFQLYVETEPDITYFELVERDKEKLLPLAVFDIAANNADRKGGHCLLGTDGRIWSIDHGLTFHSAFKVRSVMLEFWGHQIPKPLVEDIERLAGDMESKARPVAELAEVLDESEMEALRDRLSALAKDSVTPQLNPYVNVPWPLV